MAYTSHGHHVDGTGDDGIEPPAVMECGGVSFCGECKLEAILILRALLGEAYEKFSRPEMVKPRVENSLLKHFFHADLPPEGRAVMMEFVRLATFIDQNIENEHWKTIVLSKLLEAKTVAIRAVL